MSGRGRGKKTTTKTLENDIKEEKPTKKISKKKQFPVVAVVGPEGIEGNLLPESRRPLIVHLPLQSKDIQYNDMPITYDPHPPSDAEPYDINADNPFYEDVEQYESQNDNTITNISHTYDKVQTNVLENTVESTNIVTEQDIDYYNIKCG
jgi:hypothetical protein